MNPLKTYKKKTLFILCFIILVLTVRSGQSMEDIKNKVGLFPVPGTSNNTELKTVKRILNIQGIQYDILKSPRQIHEYSFIIIAGQLLNKNVNHDLVNELYDYADFSGTLLAAGEVGNILYPLFGITDYKPSQNRYRLYFKKTRDPALRYIDHPNEYEISLGNGEKIFYKKVIWSHGYNVDRDTEVLGSFKDGMAGFIKYHYGRGTSYLLGLSFTESVLIPQVGQDYEAQRKFVNTFEPSADVIMLIIKAIYEHYVNIPVYISPIPQGKTTALIITHDVDAQTSFVDSLKFAELEKKYSTTSTFFINTKYFTDWMDIGYYNIPENKEALIKLKNMGFDIGSHTVSHYKKLSEAPEGDPNVTFKTYNPQNQITVHGEVRVSKELLDRDIPGQNTISYRSGDLEFPPTLIKALDQAGYLYDSTFSANDILTAFPYRALKLRIPTSEESRVIEIPVTLDESMGFLTPEKVERAVTIWNDVIYNNMKNEAISVLLIHPSDTREKNYKLIAEEKVIKYVKSLDGWMGNLTEFGNFWRHREKLKFSWHLIEDNTLVIKINEVKSKIDKNISFVIAKPEKIKSIRVTDINEKSLAFKSFKRNSKLYIILTR